AVGPGIARCPLQPRPRAPRERPPARGGPPFRGGGEDRPRRSRRAARAGGGTRPDGARQLVALAYGATRTSAGAAAEGRGARRRFGRRRARHQWWAVPPLPLASSR